MLQSLPGTESSRETPTTTLSRLEKSAALSHAFVCMHEFKEVGAMEMEGTNFRTFFISGWLMIGGCRYFQPHF
jgi:hypothetical protein